MRFLAVAFLFAAILNAQPGCPPVNFQNVISTSTQPSASSQLTFVRQPDGSYTAYEMSNATPYNLIGTTRNFGSELTRCVPREASLPTLPAPQGSGNLPGATSQPEVFARLASGGYLQVRTLGGKYPIPQTMEFSIFDASMTLILDTPSSVGAYQLSLVDVNGDGKLDLVALALSEVGYGQDVVVFLGNGDGTFQAPIRTLNPVTVGGPAGENAAVFSVADIDGDGKPDLVLATRGNYASDNNLYLMRGHGDGTFGTPILILSENPIYSLALADLNGDGNPDIILSGQFDLQVILGAGGGSFQTPVSYSNEVTSGYSAVLVEDVDGDGHPDIVTNGGVSISILFGDGKGNFPRRADYLCPTSGGIVLADINGDGRVDILTGVTGNPLIFAGYNPGGPNMSVLFGREGGTFWGAPISVATNDPGAITVGVVSADFNGDGLPDLATIELFGNPPVGKLRILNGLASGFFTVTDQYSVMGAPDAVVTADFNGDGKPDLAVAGPLTPPQPNIVHIFTNNGQGAVQELSPIFLAGGLFVNALVTGDFNHDGKQDLAVLTTTQNGGSMDEVLIFLGNGDGTFRAGASYPVGAGASAIATGDFRGDGRIDLATANSGTNGGEGTISVLLGNGDGTFLAASTAPLSEPNGDTPFQIAEADLKGDGKADLVVTLFNNEVTGVSPALAVLLGRGDGTFLSPVLYPVTGDEAIIADLNDDGIPDLVDGAGYLLGNGDGTFAPEVLLPDGFGALIAVNLHGADLEIEPGNPFRRGQDWDSGLSLIGDFGGSALIAFPNASPPSRGIHRRGPGEPR